MEHRKIETIGDIVGNTIKEIFHMPSTNVETKKKIDEENVIEIYNIFNECLAEVSLACDEMNKLLLAFSKNNNDTLFVINDEEPNKQALSSDKKKYLYDSLEIHNGLCKLEYREASYRNNEYTSYSKNIGIIDANIVYSESKQLPDSIQDYLHLFFALKKLSEAKDINFENYNVLYDKVMLCRRTLIGALKSIIDKRNLFLYDKHGEIEDEYPFLEDETSIDSIYSQLITYVNNVVSEYLGEQIEKSKLFKKFKTLDKQAELQYLTHYVLNDKEHNSKLKDNLFKGTSVEEISENKKYKDFYDFVHNDVKADTKASDLVKLFECLKNK